jgi:DNA-binding NarL/FixJ family response regulator
MAPDRLRATIRLALLDDHPVALAARVAHADAVVGKTEPVSALLTAIRLVAAGETMLPQIPRESYETATERLAGEDLSVLAMLLDGEAPPAIAEALCTEPAEIAWRAQRIIGRIRPGASRRADEDAIAPADVREPELPLR